ncbi:enoyl-CoA hydratase-related protein [Frankia sp. AiPa1]|uniref:enoyl-CoA hydratase-related protein n=1 Tax=Frankia sp. AiPa1 TaxID=573492 RepID=UPI00202B64F1|nr:enoyl-CoA hydratase-related protein [Frankia sp. AiPa1]MCL9762686.1 enoyl-CoA hydratase-related protein [Frankia sp. AiPa1]
MTPGPAAGTGSGTGTSIGTGAGTKVGAESGVGAGGAAGSGPGAGTDVVVTSRRGRVLVIRIDREAKRNALNPAVTAGIDQAMNELEDDPELWCGVLTGGPRMFSAGADLAMGPGEPTERGGLVGLIHRTRTKPLIAAVEGFALGGGVELVLCCDLVVAARDARFGLPEVKRGLMPDFGGAFRITRVLPRNVAFELLATGDGLPAERAERLGFVNVLTEPGEALDGALALAERVNANAPLAVRAALDVARREVSPDESAIWAHSDATHAHLLTTADVREGIDAFFGRRPPTWTAR